MGGKVKKKTYLCFREGLHLCPEIFTFLSNDPSLHLNQCKREAGFEPRPQQSGAQLMSQHTVSTMCEKVKNLTKIYHRAFSISVPWNSELFR